MVPNDCIEQKKMKITNSKLFQMKIGEKRIRRTYRQMKSKSSIDCTARVCIPQTMALVVLLNNCSYFLASAADTAVTDCWRMAPTEIWVDNLAIFGLTTAESIACFYCV